MLFKRRFPASFWQQFRAALWPKKGFLRVPVYLYHRTIRLRATPHAIAMGIAAGAFVSWTPFIGGHIIFAVCIAFLFGGNLFAAALGTAVGNPFTFPFIWLSTWEFGNSLLGRSSIVRDHIDLFLLIKKFELSDLWRPLLEPMAVGSVIPGLVCGCIFYLTTYISVRSFQKRRQALLTLNSSKRADNILTDINHSKS